MRPCGFEGTRGYQEKQGGFSDGAQIGRVPEGVLVKRMVLCIGAGGGGMDKKGIDSVRRDFRRA